MIGGQGLTDADMAPSRFKSPEFIGYLTVSVVGISSLFWIAHGVSAESHPNFHKYSHRLSRGWLGLQVDNSDGQYATFRSNIFVLVAVMCTYLFMSFLVPILVPLAARLVSGRLLRHEPAQVRRIYTLAFSLVFIYVLHGNGLFKILLILLANYAIAKLGKGSLLTPIGAWVLGLSILFLNDRYQGYKFASVTPLLASLDRSTGLMGRWWITFNFSVLRMISFSMDYFWSRTQPQGPPKPHRKHCEECLAGRICQRGRSEDHLNETDYNLFNYYLYALYVPLFMAGPILSFNDFVAQTKTWSLRLTKATLVYAARWIGVVVLMEVMQHTLYVVAIAKSKAWDGFTPAQIVAVGFINLKFIWMKLLIIWRFFRLWAMADGIETTENMNRCMTNNYSAMGFWRSWHRSFNRWLIRYVYAPLGGAQYYAYNVWIVFTFVALWHDISMTLLAWAWLIVLFIMPEIVATRLFVREPYTRWRHFLAICGIGAVFNICFMIVANLVGFAVGVEGMTLMLKQTFVWSWGGAGFLVAAFATLYCSARVMFAIREAEASRSDNRRD
ncbi:MBOAT, membrane-bound O-acyltransferase family-domain-containing protein [Polychytrium aggregatum]|uniref:MBOAT, membrane-bound O-acyltransferase family-domain-containing protein n=1 Tax=Polychytrium aggregatum TaxID=110093 RepID=UPI0022FF1945|nr:MBOAT, membrane-bound O-acyltransferase family-domain-containing protein [Polychytrium aggregatum]KAI9197313.1 MBOAT, membrane-bound O-acyltransferase family-domain-containing protein [Polychytrium aggregatum]